MKKIGYILIFLFVSLFSLCAEVRIDLVPYQGFSGIPVGTNLFKGTGTAESGADSWPWASMTQKYTDNNASALNSETYRYHYTDKEMVGMIALQSHSSSSSSDFSTFTFKGPVTITVNAPNGLYLESQSDPYYRRPIELWLYPSYIQNKGDQQKLGSDYFVKISNQSPTISALSGLSITNATDVWFDVVLVLPGKLDEDTNEIVTDDGTRYPLKDAEDYSCLITISVEYYDVDTKKTISNSITIPFSGYYKSGQTQTIADSSVSMNIMMDAKAYNIDIDSERGKEIRIGNISFVGTSGSFGTTAVNAAIFFSSSSSPTKEGSKFAMVLDSLGVNEERSSLNSIPFTLKVKNGEGTGYITFDGTTYAKSSWDGIDDFDSTKFIIPQKDSGSLFYNYGQGSSRYTIYFKNYVSDIILQLESNDLTMLKGRYEGEIYVHVVTV